jgi:hypothetical protein
MADDWLQTTTQTLGDIADVLNQGADAWAKVVNPRTPDVTPTAQANPPEEQPKADSPNPELSAGRMDVPQWLLIGGVAVLVLLVVKD